MRPFFFGESSTPLFGLHHPPKGKARGHAVLLCPPFGQEYLRAHRALQQLAERLAGAGFDVLRFDYFGCGDSSGEGHEGRLDRWLADTRAGIDEAEALCGSPRVGLVGVRLGAALATRALAGAPPTGPLVLWDPVLDGEEYLEGLGADHEVWMRERARVPPGRALHAEQRMGFPLPEVLRAQIAELRGAGVLGPVQAGVCVVATDGSGIRREQATAGPLVSAEVLEVAGPPVWRRDEGDGMAGSLVPLETIERITAWLAARCP